MNQSENRKSMAINRFLEAEHVYLEYIDKELDQRSKLVNEYLLTLFLAYTAEIRCYLKLEEFDRAVQRLQEGSEKIRSRIRRYVEILLTSNPAVYLHPKFKNQISLSRLTKIYQWIDPSLNESAVFELQRNNLFRSKMDKGSELEYKWVTSLPPAIVSKSEIQGTIWGNIEETKLEAMNRLPQVLETMESMIETIQRFDSFQFEVKAISKLNITFHNWSQLTLAKEQSSENATLMYLIPSNPVQF